MVGVGASGRGWGKWQEVGASGRRWGKVAGGGGRVWGHVARVDVCRRGSGLQHGWGHVAGVVAGCGRMW